MLRCRRTQSGHRLSILHYRSRDQLFTFINVTLAITILGFSAISSLLSQVAGYSKTLFDLLIALFALLNVIMSALQYIYDNGMKAVSHERAAGQYAILNRWMEMLYAEGSASDHQLTQVKAQLDILAMILPYPPKRFRDRPHDLTARIQELEAQLAAELHDGPPN